MKSSLVFVLILLLLAISTQESLALRCYQCGRKLRNCLSVSTLTYRNTCVPPLDKYCLKLVSDDRKKEYKFCSGLRELKGCNKTTVITGKPFSGCIYSCATDLCNSAVKSEAPALAVFFNLLLVFRKHFRYSHI